MGITGSLILNHLVISLCVANFFFVVIFASRLCTGKRFACFRGVQVPDTFKEFIRYEATPELCQQIYILDTPT